MFPLIFFGAIVAIFVGFYLLKVYRDHQAAKLLARLRLVDSSWDHDDLKRELEDIRAKVMSAIERSDVEPVRGLMTRSLYNRLKGKNAEQFGFRTADWSSMVISTSKKIVDVEDYEDDTKDRLGMYVSYISMTGRGKEGPSDEFWVFVRDGGNWIVSDIHPKAGVLDLTSSRAYSQALTVSDNIAKMDAAGEAAAVPVEAEEAREERAGRKEYKTGRRDYR